MCEPTKPEIWCWVDDPSEQMSKQQLSMYAMCGANAENKTQLQGKVI